MQVGITYNLKRNSASGTPDAEAEYDEPGTIQAIETALTEAGHVVSLYEAIETLPSQLEKRRPDIVFNIAEGSFGRGREAQVPAILSYMNIPYTGSDETTMCIAMDKALAKRLVSSYGERTPEYALLDSKDDIIPELRYPVLVKPNAEGSSKGLSLSRDRDDVRRAVESGVAAYGQSMLAEEYIDGRELTVGILGNGRDIHVFPPMEIIFNDDKHRIYSYTVKQNYKQFVTYKCPPDISTSLQADITDTAKRIYTALECRDLARIDFRLSDFPYFIELNPLPGLAPGYSDFPMIAEFCGIGYNELIQNILNCAIARYNLRKD